LSRNQKRDQEYVTYEHIPKPDLAKEEEKINIDQRFDRCHKDNHGHDYRSKWVKIARGPSTNIYSSIFARDNEACMNPALTGYVGAQTGTSDSYITKNDDIDVTSKVNRILTTKQDYAKHDIVKMLLNIQHVVYEREKLGQYEIPQRIRSKMEYLSKKINDISTEEIRREEIGRSYIGDYPVNSVKSLLSYSPHMAPIRPDNGKLSCPPNFNLYYGPRIARCFL